MRDFMDVLKETTSRMRESQQAYSFGSHGEPGFQQIQTQRTEKYQRTLMEAARLTNRVVRGDRYAALMFQEAMTTSDFSVYFGDILDRQVLANYQETPSSWPSYTKRSTLRDFRQAKRFRFDRGGSILNGPILPNDYGASGSGPTGLQEVTEYPERKRVASDYDIQLYKFGARMPFSWETMVNDDLNALKDTPSLLAQAARRTEEQIVTGLYSGAAGPDATFFSLANNNIVTAANNAIVTTLGLPDNPPLSITALHAAMVILATQRDLDGMPIAITGYTLVVSPQNDIPARNIINASQIWMNDQGGTKGSGSTGTNLQRLQTQNWAAGMVQVAVNYFAPIVNTTNGDSAWYIFANPNNGRPALELGFLSGHETPELFMKASNQVRIGGDSIGGASQTSPMDGDFDTDAIHYKVRHILGGTLLDPIMAVASNGTGS